MERLGRVHRVLADHRIDDQIDLMRLNRTVDRFKLCHQLVVDVKPPGRIEDQHIDLGLASLGKGALTHANRDTRHLAVLGALVRLGVEMNLDVSLALLIDLLGNNAQLLDRSGALQVGGGNHDTAPAPLEIRGEFAAGRRLARTLQTAHHHNGGRRLDEHDWIGRRAIRRGHQRRQPLMNDADHLLARLEALGDLAPHGLLGDVVTESRDDRKMNIRFQQGGAHLAHGLRDIVVGDPPAPRKVAEGCVEPVRECFEHSSFLRSRT